MSSPYASRKATIADIPVIVGHRRAMFTEMGVRIDEPVLNAFERWLVQALPASIYHAWVVEAYTGIPRGGSSTGIAGATEIAEGSIVAGAGLTVIPWPPGPRDINPRAAFVYNVYTERAHRRRGLARGLMIAIHDWCRAQGIRSILLHASPDGRTLYEALGYRLTNEMRLTMED